MTGREQEVVRVNIGVQKELSEFKKQSDYEPGRIFGYFLIIVGAICVLVPLLWALLTSFKSNADVYTVPIRWFPKVWKWVNYKQAFEIQPLLLFFTNSFIVAVITTASSLFLSAMAAYSFARLEFKGKNTLFYIWMGTMSIPVVITLIPSFIMMQQFNLVNKLEALIVPFMGGGISGIFLLRQFMATIPAELEEAAFLDGCSRFRMFFQIILPLTRPALLTLGVFLFTTSWNNFIWPLLMIREKTKATLPLGLSYYMSDGQMGKNFDWGILMAASLLAVLPLIIIYIFVQKKFIAGITLSGLKS